MLSCGSEKPNIEIAGEIKGAEKTKVYLEKVNVDAIIRVDSTKIDKNGRFTFNVHDTLPTFYAVRFANGEQVTLVVGSGPDEVKQEISGTLEDIQNNYWVEGSEHSLWIKLLNFQLNRTTSVTDSLLKVYRALPKEAEYNSLREEYSRGWEEALAKQRNFTHEFILKHAISPASYYALYQKIQPEMFIMDELEDYQHFKIVASSMSALYPESQYTKALMNHLKEINRAIRNQQLILAINNSASSLPDIELPNSKGVQVSLNTLKNKLIILDFNVLATKESQTYIHDMKNVYNKFRGQGVEIYQVCLDKSRLLWETAVEQNNINWICVWDTNSLQSRAAASWNVKEIPANYIINQNKEIVGKNLYGDRLADRLTELLKQ